MRYLLFFILLIFIFACEQTITDVLTDEQSAIIDQYIIEHPVELLDVNDEITIRFRRGHSIDTTSTDGLRIMPSLKGVWKWIDSTTVTFQREHILHYDQQHAINVDIDEVLGGDDDREAYIPFRTRPLQLNIVNVDQNKIRKDKETVVTITGEINANQYVDEELIKERFQIGGVSIGESLSWEETSTVNKKMFSIRDVIQTKEHQELTLSIKDLQGRLSSRKIRISGYADFLFEQLLLKKGDRSVVHAQFSLPLDEKQSTKGLVSIDGDSKNVRSEIEGSVLKIYPANALSKM